MTRINLVDPEELMDQHLMAEFREIKHVGPALKRSLNSVRGLSLSDIPENFTLNTGHVKFFYDKGLYLKNRYEDIYTELYLRGFNIKKAAFDTSFFSSDFYNDWIPSETDFAIIRERIAERIAQKPDFYRKTEHIC